MRSARSQKSLENEYWIRLRTKGFQYYAGFCGDSSKAERSVGQIANHKMKGAAAVQYIIVHWQLLFCWNLVKEYMLLLILNYKIGLINI